jgi:hypothetical protein
MRVGSRQALRSCMIACANANASHSAISARTSTSGPSASLRLRRTGAVAMTLLWGAGMAGCGISPSALTSEPKSAIAPMSLTMQSVPSGAQAQIHGGSSCRTPCELTVRPTGPFVVEFTLSNHEPQSVQVVLAASNPEDISAGIRLDPNPVTVTLTAIAQPRVKVGPPKTSAARPAVPQSAQSVPPENTGIVASRWPTQ